MPRNMSGREMSRIDWLMVTITTPRVARQRAVHFWGIATGSTLAAHGRVQHEFAIGQLATSEDHDGDHRPATSTLARHLNHVQDRSPARPLPRWRTGSFSVLFALIIDRAQPAPRR